MAPRSQFTFDLPPRAREDWIKRVQAVRLGLTPSTALRLLVLSALKLDDVAFELTLLRGEREELDGQSRRNSREILDLEAADTIARAKTEAALPSIWRGKIPAEDHRPLARALTLVYRRADAGNLESGTVRDWARRFLDSTSPPPEAGRSARVDYWLSLGFSAEDAELIEDE